MHLFQPFFDAIPLPEAVSVVKCEAHTSSTDPISLGNAATDAAAKAAASSEPFSLSAICYL